MTVSEAESQIRSARDPRLAVHATSALPVWLWSHDGMRILWANPVGADVFGAYNSSALIQQKFGPADQHHRQVVRLAGCLALNGATRLERLRGFGAPLGRLRTCACARLVLTGGGLGILITAVEPVGRTMSYEERVQRLINDIDAPVIAFTSIGGLMATNRAAAALIISDSPGDGASASVLGIDQACRDAVRDGSSEVVASIGQITFQRIGQGTDIALLAFIIPREAYISRATSRGEPSLTPRRHPLRFMWQMDADGRFSLGSDEFSRLIGPRTITAFGRPWSELTTVFGIDPDGRVASALATRNTWSGIMVDWPVDGPIGRIPIELSAVPFYDRAKVFLGYRGFGVCRDLEGLTLLTTQRQRDDVLYPISAASGHDLQGGMDNSTGLLEQSSVAFTYEPSSPLAKPDNPMDTPQNVVPFQPSHEHKAPTLTPVETKAFYELAQKLASRLDTEQQELDAPETSTKPATHKLNRILDATETSQADLAPMKRQVDRAAQARSDILARISHEVCTPLNVIIGFADVMIKEQFGVPGNERYASYIKDIRAASERILTTINNLFDLSRVEIGKLDLKFVRQDLNPLVEQCVLTLQPQANRERIIIRTSLAHALPPVKADAATLQQIVLNLVSNSIHGAKAGGQVIVSTALTDLGDVVLRVRDTRAFSSEVDTGSREENTTKQNDRAALRFNRNEKGSRHGVNHSEMETSLKQFCIPTAEQLAQDNTGISLSLTKALAEANRAKFRIKTAPRSGTLAEIAFPRAQVG